MFHLKPIAADSVPQALSKAERYRLLNEPREAESICLDVLALHPDDQSALVCLLLAYTDMFEGMNVKAHQARDLLLRLRDRYERAYYAGIIEERWAKALLSAGYPWPSVHSIIQDAMERFDEAQNLAPPANNDAILRWNACVRLIERHGDEQSEDAPGREHFDDDVPMR